MLTHMRARRCPDLINAIRIARDLGGEVSEVLDAKRHVRVKMVTQLGNPLMMTLSKSKTDPRKLKGWIRQDFNKADALAKQSLS